MPTTSQSSPKSRTKSPPLPSAIAAPGVLPGWVDSDSLGRVLVYDRVERTFHHENYLAVARQIELCGPDRYVWLSSAELENRICKLPPRAVF